MKKLLLVLVIVIAVAFFVFTRQQEKSSLTTGVLNYQGTTEQDFQTGFEKFRNFLLASDKKSEFSSDEFLNSIMKADGTFDKLAKEYIEGAKSKDLEAVIPEKFDNADELKILVTGDMPPIDMFAENGEPTGYNTAVISEIGKRLKKNVKFISTEAGGRSAALLSGRADVIFWYRSTRSKNFDALNEIFADAPQGVILSMPYYSWNRDILIRMNETQGILGWFKK